MGQLPYEMLEEIFSYCTDGTLTNVTLCDTALYNIGRRYLYYRLDFYLVSVLVEDNIHLAKLTSTSLHLLRFTYHLNLRGTIHVTNYENVIQVIERVIQLGQLRSCVLQLDSDTHPPTISSLNELIQIPTLHRFSMNLSDDDELWYQALVSTSLRDLTVSPCFVEQSLRELPSSPRPPLDTIRIDYFGLSPPWHEIKHAFNLSQIRRVHLWIPMYRKTDLEDKFAESLVPFIMDLPEAKVEGFAIDISDHKSALEMGTMQTYLSMFQYFPRFKNLQVISVHLRIPNVHSRYLLDFIVDILASYLQPQTSLRMIQIFIKFKYSPNEYLSGLNNHPCFVKIHNKLPNATVNLYLENPFYDIVLPVHITGVDKVKMWPDQGPFSDWPIRKEITDVW